MPVPARFRRSSRPRWHDLTQRPLSTWHIVALLLLTASPALAQPAPTPPEPEPSPSIDSDADSDAQPQEAASSLSPPVETARARLAREPIERPAPATAPRTRFWRMPRELVRRPLTLPQAVIRFDKGLAFSVFGTRAYGTGTFGFGVGLHDDFELGATPVVGNLGPPSFDQPSVYARARALSGDVQLAVRSRVWVPLWGQQPTMWEVAVELAATSGFFRFDAALEYALLFSDPLHQRIGAPLTATLQAGPNGFSMTSGLYVYNDFDDVDVPLLFAWTYAFRGFQGPLADARIEGGIADLSRAEQHWLIRWSLRFYAYP